MIITTILLLCFSCGSNKYLGEKDYLVKKNKIILEDIEDAVEDKSQTKYELSTLITQKPNSKLLFFFKPELYWHFRVIEKRDKIESKLQRKFLRKGTRIDKKIDKIKIKTEEATSEKRKKKLTNRVDNKGGLLGKKQRRSASVREYFKRRFTEPPVLYNRETMEETAVSMANYLKNKGFFDAKVYPSNSALKDKHTEITYKVFPGNLYTVDTLILESKDPTLDSLKNWLSQETLMSAGSPVDISLYNQEVGRITDSLRNNGYAYFYSNNIKPLETDTTGVGYKLTIYDELLKPFEGSIHKKYKFGKINVYSNFNGELGEIHQDTLINGLHYKTLDGDIGIKPKLIKRNIYFNEGDDFNQSLINKTNQQLNALGVYKFVNVRSTPSQTNEDEVDIDIILSKLKKQNVTIDADINNSERFLTNRRSIFFGNSLNLSYLNRNTFLGAERLGVSFEGGVEFNLSTPDTLINSIDLVARVDMRLPEFVDIPGTWKLLSLLKLGKKSLINPEFMNAMRTDGIPTFSLSNSLFSLRGFYSYNSLNATLGYDLKRTATEKYTINTIGLTLFQSQTESAFDIILDSSPLLKERLRSRLITGLFYSEFSYLWTTPQANLGETWQFRFNHELSGAEALLANFIVKGGKEAFDLPGDLEFAHFTKVEFDVRYFKQFRDGNVLGLRANLGAAVPFSRFSQTVPFVKQFHVGGPNSIRAWRIRELGPGQYDDLTDSPPFFQTGDFKFEFNLEYRFKLIPFLQMDGAVFLDGGNIWTLKDEPSREGSQLLWRSREENGRLIGDNFIDQIALGTGVGIRIDFTYFVLTLDVGLKLRSPFILSNGSRWYFDDYKPGSFGPLLNPNLLFGYPF